MNLYYFSGYSALLSVRLEIRCSVLDGLEVPCAFRNVRPALGVYCSAVGAASVQQAVNNRHRLGAGEARVWMEPAVGVASDESQPRGCVDVSAPGSMCRVVEVIHAVILLRAVGLDR